MGNPQTDRLLEILHLNHTLTRPFDQELTPERISSQLRGIVQSVPDSNEIDIDLDDDGDDVDDNDSNEIDIDDLVDDDNQDDDEDSQQSSHVVAKKAKVESIEGETMTS
jgi:hypothetical protein